MKYGKLLRSALRWVVDAVSTEATAVLTVRVPAATPEEAAAALALRLGELVNRRAAELGSTRRFVPAQETDPAAERITVLLAGRPVAVVPAAMDGATATGWVAGAAHTVDRAVLRRPSVLVDVAAAAEAATRSIPGARGLVEGAIGHLVDSGVSVSGLDPVRMEALVRRVPASATAELAELLIEELAPRQIVVEAAAGTLRSAGDRPDDLVLAREELFASTGLQFPDVSLRAVDEPPGTLRIRLNDVTVERLLATAAGWSDVVAAVKDALRDAAPWFVRTSEVEDELSTLRNALPDLVDLVRRCYAPPLLAACLRELLRHGDSIRNMPRILWLLLEVDNDVGAGRVSISEPLLLCGPTCSGRIPSEPVTLAARVRRQATEDLVELGSAEDDDVVLVPADVEAELVGATDAVSAAAAELLVLDCVPAVDRPLRVVVRSVSALAPVRAVLQALPRPPRVICTEELGLFARGGLPHRVHI